MKPDVRVTLFGRFSVTYRSVPLLTQSPGKVQELFSYLLLNRWRAHSREGLADLLWGEAEPHNSLKYLRQAVWQLRAGLEALGRDRALELIPREPGWVQVLLPADVWVDVVEFETAFRSWRRGSVLRPTDLTRITNAIGFYRTGLLEGQSSSWCIYERDRLRQMYLALLDRLVQHFEHRGSHETAIDYCRLALQCDRARERTHRTLMTLRQAQGDRTGALRQYERCRAALQEDLGIAPSAETVDLYRAIRSGQPSPARGARV